ncbi:MAG: CsbD family protein [Thermoleophilia bacterium]|nr:CsbD family protein [Thermoleophilia bacterium]
MDRDRIEGNLKEAEGKLTGDEELEREGEAQDSWGKAKDKADDAWEDTKDAAGDLKDSVDKRT